MPRAITASTSLDTLKKEAKRWLSELRASNAEARARFERAYPNGPRKPVLRDVQHALAREYEHQSWITLRQALAERQAVVTPERLRTVAEYERLANEWVLAFDARDEAALQRLNTYYDRAFSFDDLAAEIWRRVYAFRQRSSQVPKNFLELSEAQMVIAQDAGFGSWTALTHAALTGGRPIPGYAIDTTENAISPRRRLSAREWDDLIAVMNERQITALHGQGLVSDAVLARVAALDHVTALDLSGSRELTDTGLALLGRMPQLQRLNLSGYPGGALTDRALEVLRHLPSLQRFEMTWQRGISDAGVANLEWCQQLERVNLMGSPTGDGAIKALQGKSKLKQFSTGRLVSDDGLRLLHNFPLLKQWHGPPIASAAFDTDATRLLIDGPFTDSGLASLAGLEGIFELDLFWHTTGVTPDGLASLVGLPNLGALGADGKLSDNVAMRHFATLPQLRRLRAQGTVATDEGFEALSRSNTLEFLWGRECPNLASRGFVALSRMPALRGLGVSCKNVDDAALSMLPQFPSLRELTPIDVKDDGFVHIGGCEQLERLTCMYCRDTTDAATAHVARLRLKYYYAGLTGISDRTLEILGAMTSLEQIDLYECNGVTDAGLVFLAAMPNLREVNLDSLRGVTLAGTRILPKRIRVKYST